MCRVLAWLRSDEKAVVQPCDLVALPWMVCSGEAEDVKKVVGFTNGIMADLKIGGFRLSEDANIFEQCLSKPTEEKLQTEEKLLPVHSASAAPSVSPSALAPSQQGQPPTPPIATNVAEQASDKQPDIVSLAACTKQLEKINNTPTPTQPQSARSARSASATPASSKHVRLSNKQPISKITTASKATQPNSGRQKGNGYLNDLKRSREAGISAKTSMRTTHPKAIVKEEVLDIAIEAKSTAPPPPPPPPPQSSAVVSSSSTSSEEPTAKSMKGKKFT